MEGATLSGRQASAYIRDAGEELLALRKKIATEFQDLLQTANTNDELSLVWETIILAQTTQNYISYLPIRELQSCVLGSPDM